MEPDPQNSAPHRVDAYLDEVLAPLASRLSPFQQSELRRELREHLWERVDAYLELRQPGEDAVTEALRQFGGAEDFTRKWQREWTKTTPRVTLSEVRQAIRLALPLSLSAQLLAQLPEIIADYTFRSDINGPSGWFYNHYNVIVDISACLYFTLPIALGLIVARHLGKSASPALFTSLVAICLFSCLMSFTGGYLWEYAVRFRQEVNATIWIAAIWIPLACASAALVNKWARRQRKVLA